MKTPELGQEIDIVGLAWLFLETQKPYGEASGAACKEFEMALRQYRDTHEHYMHEYPDVEFRESKIRLSVRTQARRLITSGATKPASLEIKLPPRELVGFGEVPDPIKGQCENPKHSGW